MKWETREKRTTKNKLTDRFTERPAARAKRLARKKVSPVTRKVMRRLLNDDLDLSPDLLKEIVHDQMVRWARQGGRARAAALSPARRREIARKANAAKRAKGGR